MPTAPPDCPDRLEISPPPRERPLLIFDGECHFCRQWVARWRDATAGRVDFTPFQEAAARFPEIPRECFQAAVRLVEPDGRVSGGARAVFRALSFGPGVGGRALRWGVANVPGFGALAETGYRAVARHREAVSWLTAVLWGPGGGAVRRPTFGHAGAAFLRLLGGVYLLAFGSLWTQVDGLIGSRGIAPAAPWLQAAHAQLGARAYALLPTLGWLDAGDGFLRGLCAVGAGLAAGLMLGAAPALCLILLWVCYLSLAVAGQQFLSFQWDTLLLETGFFAIFLAPRGFWPLGGRRTRARPPPSRAALFLLWWLLFRLMLMSGAVKLSSGDEAWWNLSALDFHYETQPLPTPLGWWAHAGPEWLKRGAVLGMFAVEIGLPFLFFAPRRPRLLAAGAVAALQAGIALTGNYGFFNLLTASLCVLLVDDAVWPRWLGRRADPAEPPRVAETAGSRWPGQVSRLALGATLLLSVPLLWESFFPRAASWPGPLAAVYRWIEPFRSLNSYGLFRVMTRTRPEIIVEGSDDDGRTWRAYVFRFKPGDLSRAPPWVAPHMPRLDWQMWFAALSDVRREPWFVGFLVRLLEGSPPVLGLLETNPFPDHPPRLVRARLFEYRFTDPATRRRTGEWWRREELGLYCPPISLRNAAVTAPGVRTPGQAFATAPRMAGRSPLVGERAASADAGREEEDELP